MSHANAPLTPEGRRRLCARIDAGRPIAHVAAEARVSRRCLAKWYARWLAFGDAGLENRPSRPAASPRETQPEVADLIELVRRQAEHGIHPIRRVLTDIQRPPGTGLPMSAEARAAAAPYADRIWERLVELAAAGVTGPSGAQVFPGSPADARAWDVFAERRWPVPPRVWMVADLQAGDAPPPGREQDAAG